MLLLVQFLLDGLLGLVVVAVWIGVAGVGGVRAHAGELLVALACQRENVFDLMRLARHLVEDELELRGQAQTGLGAHHGAQASLGLVERLLGALAFALLMAVPAQRGPVDLGELEIIGHLDVGDRHVLESLVVQRGFHIRGDHTLDERRDAGGARIGSLHGVPYCLTSYAVLLFNTSRKPPCALGENGRRP